MQKAVTVHSPIKILGIERQNAKSFSFLALAFCVHNAKQPPALTADGYLPHTYFITIFTMQTAPQTLPCRSSPSPIEAPRRREAHSHVS